MSREVWITRLGMTFTIQLLGLLVTGSIAAWHLDDPTMRIFSLLGSIGWLLLAIVTFVPQAKRWHDWSGFLQFLACWLIFPLLKAIHLAYIAHPADAMLLHIDRQLWGGRSLPEWMMEWENRTLSEWMSAAYFAFYFIVLLPAIGFGICRKQTHAKAFFVRLTCMYLFGFIGYVMVPASGPFLAFPQTFPYPPQGGAITAFVTTLVSQGTTGMDVFPSLHTGIGTYVLGFFILGGYGRIAALLTPIVLTLIAATMYLRYHYGIDVLCGIGLAFLVLIFIYPFLKEQH